MTAGSSALTSKQADHNERLFGVRYTHIQTDASTASRWERRRRGQRSAIRRAMAVPRG